MLFGVIISLIIVVVAAVCLFWDRSDSKKELLVVKRTYHLNTTSINEIEVPIFISKQDEKIVDEHTYGFIHNKNETKKILVSTITQKENHDETFKNSKYYGYFIMIKLPDIIGDLKIEDLYLTVFDGLGNQTLYLGSLYTTNEVSTLTSMTITELSGIKDEYMHLKQIIMKVTDYHRITKIMIADTEVPFYIADDRLIMNIQVQSCYYNNPYVKIYCGDNFYMLNNFDYFFHYQLLIDEYFTIYQM